MVAGVEAVWVSFWESNSNSDKSIASKQAGFELVVPHIFTIFILLNCLISLWPYLKTELALCLLSGMKV